VTWLATQIIKQQLVGRSDWPCDWLVRIGSTNLDIWNFFYW